MTAKYEPRIQLKNRTKLETVIPLVTPYLVFVDPSSLCNFSCYFCPTNTRLPEKKYKPSLMSFDTFKQVIGQLCQFPDRIKVLRLYKDGEPLLNTLLPEMIAYAKNTEQFDQIDLTTNGSLFTPELSNKLINAGLNKIHISLNGLSSQDYLTNCKYSFNFDRLIKNIVYFYNNKKQCHVHIKLLNTGKLSKNDIHYFYHSFKYICDSLFVENIAPCWGGSTKNIENGIEKGIYGNELTDIQVCPYIFYSISINSDGTVSICFLDWKHEEILGSVTNQNLTNIWNGDKLKNIRINHLMLQKNKISRCANCGQLTHCAPDNIDAYAKEILGKINDNVLKFSN